VLIDHIASGDHAAAAAVMRAHIDTSLGATAVQRLAQPQG
jgi:DNA-binding GntR family transcriptional regulator